MRLAVALISVAIVVATVYLGRRDLTRPAVVFGTLWFSFAALAQLHLTTAEATWSLGFAALVIGGGLAFMAASLAASGTRPARGRFSIDLSAYHSNRLLAVAILLMVGAVAGWVYKRHVLGGIPLLSGSADAVRARAVNMSGEVTVPAWSSALTGGAYIAFWCLLASAWIEWRSASWWRRAMFGGLAVVALLEVALEASRNPILSAVTVPLVAAYLVARSSRRAGNLVTVVAAGLAITMLVGGIFLARLNQAGEASVGKGFLQLQEDRHSAALRPFMPLYVNAVLPFDAYQHLHARMPVHADWGNGAYSLLSLPDALFPNGKPNFGTLVTTQLSSDTGVDFWSVATYQGRAFADVGPAGVIAESIFLGLLLGAAFRLGRSRSTLFGLALIGHVVYYSAYMSYDNLLSFSLIGFYDLAVVFAADRFARAELPDLDTPTPAATRTT